MDNAANTIANSTPMPIPTHKLVLVVDDGDEVLGCSVSLPFPFRLPFIVSGGTVLETILDVVVGCSVVVVVVGSRVVVVVVVSG